MLRTGISVLIFAVSFCYAMLIVPQDGYIDIREAILTVGGVCCSRPGMPRTHGFVFYGKRLNITLTEEPCKKRMSTIAHRSGASETLRN